MGICSIGEIVSYIEFFVMFVTFEVEFTAKNKLEWNKII